MHSSTARALPRKKSEPTQEDTIRSGELQDRFDRYLMLPKEMRPVLDEHVLALRIQQAGQRCLARAKEAFRANISRIRFHWHPRPSVSGLASSAPRKSGWVSAT